MQNRNLITPNMPFNRSDAIPKPETGRERRGPVQKPGVVVGLVLLILGATFFSSPVQAVPSDRLKSGPAEFDRHIVSAGRHYDIDPELIRCLIEQESGWKPHARSSAGALGLVQLMEETARRFGLIVDRTTDERLDPVKSIWACAAYLRTLLNLFQGRIDLALAGYNAGEGRVMKAGGIPNIRETKSYVKAILAKYAARRGRAVTAAPSPNESKPDETAERLRQQLLKPSVVTFR